MQDHSQWYLELLPFSLQVPVPIDDLSQHEGTEGDEYGDE